MAAGSFIHFCNSLGVATIKTNLRDNSLQQMSATRVTHLLDTSTPLTVCEGVHIVPAALGRHIALPAWRKMAVQGIFSCLRSCLSGLLLRKKKKKKKKEKKVLILAVLKDILISRAAEQGGPLIPNNGISLPDPRYILLQLGSVCPWAKLCLPMLQNMFPSPEKRQLKQRFLASRRAVFLGIWNHDCRSWRK